MAARARARRAPRAGGSDAGAGSGSEGAKPREGKSGLARLRRRWKPPGATRDAPRRAERLVWRWRFSGGDAAPRSRRTRGGRRARRGSRGRVTDPRDRDGPRSRARAALRSRRVSPAAAARFSYGSRLSRGPLRRAGRARGQTRRRQERAVGRAPGRPPDPRRRRRAGRGTTPRERAREPVALEAPDVLGRKRRGDRERSLVDARVGARETLARSVPRAPPRDFRRDFQRASLPVRVAPVRGRGGGGRRRLSRKAERGDAVGLRAGRARRASAEVRLRLRRALRPAPRAGALLAGRVPTPPRAPSRARRRRGCARSRRPSFASAGTRRAHSRIRGSCLLARSPCWSSSRGGFRRFRRRTPRDGGGDRVRRRRRRRVRRVGERGKRDAVRHRPRRLDRRLDHGGRGLGSLADAGSKALGAAERRARRRAEMDGVRRAPGAVLPRRLPARRGAGRARAARRDARRAGGHPGACVREWNDATESVCARLASAHARARPPASRRSSRRRTRPARSGGTFKIAAARSRKTTRRRKVSSLRRGFRRSPDAPSGATLESLVGSYLSALDPSGPLPPGAVTACLAKSGLAGAGGPRRVSEGEADPRRPHRVWPAVFREIFARRLADIETAQRRLSARGPRASPPSSGSRRPRRRRPVGSPTRAGAGTGSGHLAIARQNTKNARGGRGPSRARVLQKRRRVDSDDGTVAPLSLETALPRLARAKAEVENFEAWLLRAASPTPRAGGFFDEKDTAAKLRKLAGTGDLKTISF